MLSFPGRLALGKTELWMTFAAWLIAESRKEFCPATRVAVGR